MLQTGCHGPPGAPGAGSGKSQGWEGQQGEGEEALLPELTKLSASRGRWGAIGGGEVRERHVQTSLEDGPGGGVWPARSGPVEARRGYLGSMLPWTARQQKAHVQRQPRQAEQWPRGVLPSLHSAMSRVGSR